MSLEVPWRSLGVLGLPRVSLGEFLGSLGVFEGLWESVGLWIAFETRDIKDMTF